MGIEVKPIGSRVLVTVDKTTMPERSGLIVPEVVRDNTLTQDGVVIALGSGKMNSKGNRVPMEVSLGDRVVFGRYQGTDVKVDDQDCICLKYADIGGIVEPAA